MRFIAKILSRYNDNDQPANMAPRSSYIFYKIVDISKDSNTFALQCINTNAIFHAKLQEIIYDDSILHGLHPIQACYIGIEYAKHLKSDPNPTIVKNIHSKKLPKQAICRYGDYKLLYQNRKGNICFINILSQNEIIMDPRDIALSEELIQEFDAAQAFYIGLLAGLKLSNPLEKHPQSVLNSKRAHLWIVK